MQIDKVQVDTKPIKQEQKSDNTMGDKPEVNMGQSHGEQIIDKKYKIKISVRNLVEFVMRSGDIDNRRTDSMEKNAMVQGSKIHRDIQKRKGSNYRAEVPLLKTIYYGKYMLVIDGRADGIQNDGGKITIDEIKSTFKDVKKIKEPLPVHLSQAMCYAYIYATQNDLEEIGVQMTYCNIDTFEIRYFNYSYTLEEICSWFNELLEKYIKWSDFVIEEKIKRNASIQNLEFPFEYRKGQRDIVVSVFRAQREKKTMFIQAPTGVGKTISTLFPSIRTVGEERADKIFYLTAKTITRTVAEEGFEILRKNGLYYRSITLTAKEKCCTCEKVDCNPVNCTRARGHFDRVNDAIYELITNEMSITRDVIDRYAEKHNVCPFEMSLDVSMFVDGIICDYNYVFDPNVKLKRYFSEGIEGDYLFLVDEAHNMVDRAREMYSAAIVKEDFLNVKKIVKDLTKGNVRGMVNGLTRCNKEMLGLKRITEGCTKLYEIDELIKKMLKLQNTMEKFLDDNKEFSGRDVVLDFYFQVRNFLNIYELVDENYIMYSDFSGNGDFFVKLYCVNPSNNIKECMMCAKSTMFFSATLLPVNYYKELLSGDVNDYAIYIDSPFDENKRIIAVADDVSSKYTRRGREEYEKICRYIKLTVDRCAGNYMVFFPSYGMMKEIYVMMKELYDVKTEESEEREESEVSEESEVCEEDEESEKSEDNIIEIICQSSNMKEEEREVFLQKFDKDNDKTLIGFCVLGGIFSEGIDLKNERLIGSIIVGTGLSQICPENELLKNFFDEKGSNGFDYAYRFPGMNKVLQAAGRVIRTDQDFGVIELLDERFLERRYLNLFPKEWVNFKRINMNNADDEIKRFWRYV